MSDLNLYFDYEPTSEAGAGQLASELQSKLEGLDVVRSAEVPTKEQGKEARMTGVEILALVTLAASVVHNARQISDDVAAIANNIKSVFETIRTMAKELNAKDVSIQVKGKRKSIFHLQDDDYVAVAKRLASSESARPAGQPGG
jgi:hypothetical protein